MTYYDDRDLYAPAAEMEKAAEAFVAVLGERNRYWLRRNLENIQGRSDALLALVAALRRAS